MYFFLQGRANGGGLRVGEMEKDALLAHSVPHVLVERLMHSSDAYEMQVCACGLTHSIQRRSVQPLRSSGACNYRPIRVQAASARTAEYDD